MYFKYLLCAWLAFGYCNGATVIERPPLNLRSHKTVNKYDLVKEWGTKLNEIEETEESIVDSDFSEDHGCLIRPEILSEIKSYQPIVDKILNYATNEFKGNTYNTLAEMADTFGSRLSGSGQLEAAIDWMIDKSHENLLENVRTEDALVPHWVRNEESCWLTFPRLHKMSILGLGSSVGTKQEGIHAEVLVVKSFEELNDKAAQAAGKIVLYNMDYEGYLESVKYRSLGATEAAKVGAVAALVRSVAPFSINSPHTGWQSYEKGVPKIPSACVTIEDAHMLQRMQDRGNKLRIHLTMGAINYPNVVSRNTIAEIEGSTFPNEVVVVSGHFDSWDVGQGAMDDGGGAFISWNTLVLLKKLNLRPRRTIRAILWTGEEQGMWGGQSYYNNHKMEADQFQLMMESDIGTFNPLGLAFSGKKQAKCMLAAILSLLQPLNMTKVVTPMDGGPDIEVWRDAGVPTASLYNENQQYFWFHHSDGDTMDIESSDILDKCTALWASVAYVTADLSQRLPR